jgi:hypothetical protein
MPLGPSLAAAPVLCCGALCIALHAPRACASCCPCAVRPNCLHGCFKHLLRRWLQAVLPKRLLLLLAPLLLVLLLMLVGCSGHHRSCLTPLASSTHSLSVLDHVVHLRSRWAGRWTAKADRQTGRGSGMQAARQHVTTKRYVSGQHNSASFKSDESQCMPVWVASTPHAQAAAQLASCCCIPTSL